jgi:hypothetical protein
MAERSTIELMVLILTVTVCATILLIGGGIAVSELIHPEVDTSAAASGLAQVLSMILGALLGLLAGRSERGRGLYRRPDGSADEL